MTQKKTEPKTDWKVIVGGIAGLTALEIYALSLGYNGTILKSVIVIIAVAIGVTIKNPFTK